MLDGPVFVDEEYELHREIVGLGESRRTESYWTETTVTERRSGKAVAIVLLHQGVFKESYAGYPRPPDDGGLVTGRGRGDHRQRVVVPRGPGVG